MNNRTFADIMMNFQMEGGFKIPKDEQKPWWRAYASKREEVFKMATEKYLDTRENNFVPKPGELKELYNNSRTEIDRDTKTLEPKQDLTPTIPASAVKPVANVDPSRCIQQRAHNLIKRWQGFGGYGELGKIEGKDGGKYTEVIEASIIHAYGDLKTPIENEAYRLATMEGSKYSGVNVPATVKARCQV